MQLEKLERETKQAIAEALEVHVRHNWNPNWFFMTDFSDPEIKAIKEVFKGRLQSSYTLKCQHLLFRMLTKYVCTTLIL